MNYWFLYNLNDGSIYGSPYLGDTDEWTNIPDGCGVIGFMDDKIIDIVKDAFINPLSYTIVNNELVDNGYIAPTIAPVPTLEERLSSAEEMLTMLMGV